MNLSGNDELVLTVDGSLPVSTAAVEAVQALCDRAEDRPGLVTLRVSGAPAAGWTRDLTVGLVSKWERAVRRLERLGGPTVALATGEVGGTALDVLLAADVRFAAPGTRLLVAADGDEAWPGMALYRLAQQAGPAGIRRAVLFGTPITAEHALRLNLLDDIAEDGSGLLQGLVFGGEPGIRRRLLFDAATTPFEDALGAHLAACDRSLRRTSGAP